MKDPRFPARRIAHLDMDMFFAGVELLRYPELRGQAVVVGGRSAHQPRKLADGSTQFFRLREYNGRGVVTTSTYEARTFGVFSAMGLMKSAQLAPDAILLPADFESYRHYSRLFKAAVAEIAPLIENRGIDEIYVDLTAHEEDTETLAQRLKTAVHNATGLSCSIGIAANKLLAKIASDLDKPDGLTIIDDQAFRERIWPLAAKKINGIGPKAAIKLENLGIRTIADLAATDSGLLQKHFGQSYAHWLMHVAQGQDDRPVVTTSTPKSMSRETTFERDMHAQQDKRFLSTAFTSLCERVAGDLQQKGYLGHTVGIKIKYQDFRTATRDLTLPVPTNDAAAIRRAAGACLKRISLEHRFRLLGVRVSSLVRADEIEADLPEQANLFV
ncbi:DNA polymerase IV [Methylobacillus arboreus]|uniref:DNA polymerase IV n=1 Tax=Methylobacillus arboreus TaxID=755170 RepID=UPI001E5AB19A|nr:DNA polymerase IV [Methylobacillus arboreus]MCB5190991.1 DNA polymerase IV [Methylobacillus arboreus]